MYTPTLFFNQMIRLIVIIYNYFGQLNRGREITLTDSEKRNFQILLMRAFIFLRYFSGFIVFILPHIVLSSREILYVVLIVFLSALSIISFNIFILQHSNSLIITPKKYLVSFFTKFIILITKKFVFFILELPYLTNKYWQPNWGKIYVSIALIERPSVQPIAPSF